MVATSEPCLRRRHWYSPGSVHADRSEHMSCNSVLLCFDRIPGFDASAHMTEETRNAAMSGPIGIVMAIGVSAILGWFLLLALLFSIQDYDTTVASPTGQPVTQIFLDTVGEKGAIVLMVGVIPSNDWYTRIDDGSWQVIVIGAMFFCGYGLAILTIT